MAPFYNSPDSLPVGRRQQWINTLADSTALATQYNWLSYYSTESLWDSTYGGYTHLLDSFFTNNTYGVDLAYIHRSGYPGDDGRFDTVVKTLLSDSVYLNRNANLIRGSSSLGQYIATSLLDQDSITNARVASYYDSFRVADRGSYLDSVVDPQELLTADYNNDMAGFLNDLHGQPGADTAVIADALQKTTSIGALAFMASLQTNGTIDIGEPLQPTLSETIDYDRFFLAEHDIYGSSRLGMRQYLPREYVYEWDVNKSAEDNVSSRDSSEFTYRRPWYNNSVQSLYGWSGNFRPFIYYTWQGPVYSQRILGQKRYELTNHLGNVMAVVADKVTEVPVSIGIASVMGVITGGNLVIAGRNDEDMRELAGLLSVRPLPAPVVIVSENVFHN